MQKIVTVDMIDKIFHRSEEDSLTPRVGHRLKETPPRVWGRCKAGHPKRDRERNTPTGVGKILLFLSWIGYKRKHPHGCGEDATVALVKLCEQETPPRVWGRFRNFGEIRSRNGNTPTGVGKITPQTSRTTRRKKHPHGGI